LVLLLVLGADFLALPLLVVLPLFSSYVSLLLCLLLLWLSGDRFQCFMCCMVVSTVVVVPVLSSVVGI
jgi:hypothetical protein